MTDWGSDMGGLAYEGSWVVTASAHATAKSKGAYTQVVGSVSRHIHAIQINPYGSDSRGNTIVDVAIGASGSEQVIVPDLAYSTFGSVQPGDPLLLPCQIPPGTRVALRIASTVSNGTEKVSVTLYGGAGPGALPGRLVSMGVDAANCIGVPCVSGVWTELIASVPADLRGFATCIQLSSSQLFGTTLEWGVGTSGAETKIGEVGEMVARGSSFGPTRQYLPIAIAAGQRLAFKGGGSVIRVSALGVTQ